MNKALKRIIFLALVLIFGAFLSLLFIVLTEQRSLTSAKRLQDKYEGNIEFIKSEKDTDSDGIDDRTDILQGALDYVATRPVYKSKYYAGGYPDDGFGVCTDVVAFAFKAAGFDLMNLVQEDIAENPEDYDIETPDANIDFRRVKNLQVYFENTALSLTLDVHEIDQWQGGDIVVFKNHIGIVSGRRNKNGVSYVIHHVGSLQKSYEEDILESRDDITGHFRLP